MAKIDSGEYYCQAQNGIGQPSSCGAVRMEVGKFKNMNTPPAALQIVTCVFSEIEMNCPRETGKPVVLSELLDTVMAGDVQVL